MTKPTDETAPALRCRWCGTPLPPPSGTGRPREYCRRSHRQRRYEAERLARTRGLAPGEVLITRPAWEEWLDALAILRSAITDAETDLAESRTKESLRQSLKSLLRATHSAATVPLDPKAIAPEPSE